MRDVSVAFKAAAVSLANAAALAIYDTKKGEQQ